MGQSWQDSKGEWGPGLSSHHKVTAHGAKISEEEERLWHWTLKFRLHVLKRCGVLTVEVQPTAEVEKENHKGQICLFFVCYLLLFRRRRWHPTPVLLSGESHGQRSVVGCSPWGREELDMTERLHFHFSLSCIGEGNGNPLQCSCLENPRDGGAWWSAVSGVAQSRTRLKRLSSSHSVVSDSVWPHGLQQARLPCPSPSPRACSYSCPLSQWCHPTISSSGVPFSSCLQSFPASGSFPMSLLFTSGGQCIGASASASVLLIEYSGLISFRIDWFDLLAVQGTLKSLLQHNGLKASIFGTQPFFFWSSSHIHT